MKTFVFTFVFCFFCFTMDAQHLMINQDAGKLYIQHEVLAKQNWYTIGRMYNISPKEIAPFNGTSIDKILSIGQELKIPLTENNFAQEGQPAGNEVFVPLYHTVKEKEGLYRISAQYNKVNQKSLKIWNDLKNSDLGKGKEVVVGFLRVKKTVSPLAADGLTSIPEQMNEKQDQVIVKKEQPVAKEEEKTVNKIGEQSKKKENNSNASVGSSGPVNSSPNSSVSSNSNIVTETQAAPGTEGLFATAYDEQTRNGRAHDVSGSASIFRSTSGWKDGKYYVLMNSVTPGTIVKIMSTTNGRVVYAKVLGELPSIKENEGLLVRISNAAAGQLMMNESKFDITVHY